MDGERRPGWKGCLLLGGALATVALGGGGCQSMSNTDKGVLAGGALGAGAGALAGGPRHAGPGALIGGAIGAVAGGLTGAAVDNSERKQQARLAAAEAARYPPLSYQQIVQLTQSGTSDDVIINQIRSTGSVYRPTADDILYLQNSGVREPVIREVQASAYRAPPARYVYTPAPVYVVEPAPPPPAVGFGVTYVGGRRW
jgi:hypothetical protein